MASNLGDPSSVGTSKSLHKSLYRKLSPLQRSLCFLLESLRGKVVTVELKNDTVVKGVMEEADHQMNLTLFNATQTRRGSLKDEMLDTVFIQGITIRYVHLPDDLDPFQTTEQHVCSSALYQHFLSSTTASYIFFYCVVLYERSHRAIEHYYSLM